MSAVALLLAVLVTSTSPADRAQPLPARITAARQLARDTSDAGLVLLLQALDSRDEQLHDAVVASLRARAHINVLLIAWTIDAGRTREERLLALSGLRALKVTPLTPVLAPLMWTQTLRAEDIELRCAVVQTLIDAEEPLTAAVLLQALLDVDAGVRALARPALRRQDVRAAVDALLRAEPNTARRLALRAQLQAH